MAFKLKLQVCEGEIALRGECGSAEIFRRGKTACFAGTMGLFCRQEKSKRKTKWKGQPWLSLLKTWPDKHGALLAGELPPNKHKLVIAWIEIHQEDLLANWTLAANARNHFQLRDLTNENR